MATDSRIIFRNFLFTVFVLSGCGGGGGDSADSPVTAAGDTTPPVITLNGNNPETVTLNATYVDAGATAIDAVDGSVAVTTTGTVDTTVAGSYVLTYSATDVAGNTATVTRIVNVVAPTTAQLRPLNDTGIAWGANYPTGNNTNCIGETVAAQDCSMGRDDQAATGTLTKTGGGHAGFDFTKLDADGQPLADQSQSYDIHAWSCVRDNYTGLIWEVKTPSGSGDIHDASNTYRWGGKTTQIAAGQTFSIRTDDWDVLVDGANAGNGLCGFTDWRVPTIEELINIRNLNQVSPAIDTDYFPNDSASDVWSSSPYSGNISFAWGVDFSDGDTFYSSVAYPRSVRLVRSDE